MDKFQLELEAATSAWTLIPVGISLDGPIYWNVETETHLLVIGQANGTIVSRNAIEDHCIKHSDMWSLVEFSHEEFHLITLVDFLREAYDEMMDRYKIMAEQSVSHFTDLKEKRKSIMIFIDDAGLFFGPEGFIDNFGEGDTDADLVKDARDLIGLIARVGKAAGLHLALVTQRPDYSILSTDIKINITARYTIGRLSDIASFLAINTTHSKNTMFGVPGHGIFAVNGHERKVQGYFFE